MFVLNEEALISRGVTYKHTFYLVENDGVLLDATGYLAKLQIKVKRGDIKVLLDVSEYLDTTTYGPQGIILLNIPASVTTDLTLNSGVFDLLVKEILTDEISIAAVGSVVVEDAISRF